MASRTPLDKAEQIGLLTELAWTRASGLLARKTLVQREAESALNRIRQQRIQALEEGAAARDLTHRRVAERWALWADREEARLVNIAREARRQATAERKAATLALARRNAARKLVAHFESERAKKRNRALC